MPDLLKFNGPEFPHFAIWVFVYVSVIMTVLRFYAGPVVRRFSRSTGWTIVAASTVYAFGKTFLWSTTLGLTSACFSGSGRAAATGRSGSAIEALRRILALRPLNRRRFLVSLERMNHPILPALCALVLLAGAPRLGAAEPVVIDLWPGTPPGPAVELPAEADQTKPSDTLIAGRRIIKLGNVTTPQIAVYRPPAEKDTGAAVVICPGGGYHILAYDLEGTEVAEWLNGIGVTGIVLKYRVPFRDPDNRGLAGLQDAQRALSIVRHRAAEWSLDPQRIGILGFSAGGDVANRTVFRAAERQYDPVDAADTASCRPDFLVYIYGAGTVDRESGQIKPDLALAAPPPPAFFVHAWDDGVDVRNPLALATEWKRAGGQAEIHIFPTGGHGYGLRPVKDLPVTDWPALCTRWLKTAGLLDKRPETK